MGVQTSFHAPLGANDFLGLRLSRKGDTEIVYDNGARQRLVWRVAGADCRDDCRDDRRDAHRDAHRDERLADALRLAVASPRILPTLFDELSKRAIAIETVQT